ncbi:MULTISPECIES: hypothetical protein [Bacillaceae]|uniref:hypothetical protein n=1 Tax=Bacillaceae TaxID=186817 RepID=UPI000BED1AF5|nr:MULTISPECIES: hypothetical protein [unclassified Bacillus (in: firmicutes)]PEC50156.1 hypothetical protein CON00_09965 [Bacillus sp. AFS096315]PFM76135.1 hypothetical protein COJ46_19815 [Bacillus sp. AFS077874]PGZ92940.1 hypothetical protein COE53_08760 [Bacillus sp. AFS029533]
MKKKLPKYILEQLSFPVFVSPMFLISNPETVIESCKAGVIGSFPALNARTTAELEQWMKRI